ncbi:MAG: hypothetical protein MI919_20035 [Holophagales bacterium]|nr:hypothetical protein [Holophagales bacterium]
MTEAPARAQELRLAARKELVAHTEGLRRRGLTWTEPEIVVWERDPEKYTAELRIEFFSERQLKDIFEFFIYRNGSPTISLEEMQLWLDENLPTVALKGRRT